MSKRWRRNKIGGGLGSETIVTMYKDISQLKKKKFISYKILRYKTLKIYEIKNKRKLG